MVSNFDLSLVFHSVSFLTMLQLIYNFKDGGASFDLISLHPNQLKKADMAKFRRIGVYIPSEM